MLPEFALARPTTVAEAVTLLDEERVAYCGGTELLLAMSTGLLRPPTLVDIKLVDSLRGVALQDDQVCIGAATTHTEVASDPTVRTSLPLLADVERGVGNPRVRAQGSIGGNLCFAEPRSDVTALLIALRATVTLVSPSGSRELNAEDFIAGPYWTARESDELLVSVRLRAQPRRRGVYLKYQTAERPTVGVALVTEPSDDAGRLGLPVRLVVGAVGETPVAFDYPSVDDVDADQVARTVDPIPDLTGSIPYKQHVTGVYVRRATAALGAELDAEGQR